MQLTWRMGEWPWLPEDHPFPRLRVIVDNDFAGDPDALYQIVHHLLSPSVDIRGIVCSHLYAHDRFYERDDSADESRRVVTRLANTMGLDIEHRLFAGSNVGLESHSTPQYSGAAQFIISEAMRETDVPLYVACGGGLTDLASAYLMEPRIADRMTVIWIGGPEHEGLGNPPPWASRPEYNLGIDQVAAQVVVNRSTIPVWFVPRNAYRQCLVSDVELRHRVASKGMVGRALYDSIRVVRHRTEAGRRCGETYTLGDSPLVLLTALQSFFQPDPASSEYVLTPCPTIDPLGSFIPNPSGRLVRVYTRLDTRLMFEDFFIKLDEFATWLSGITSPPVGTRIGTAL